MYHRDRQAENMRLIPPHPHADPKRRKMEDEDRISLLPDDLIHQILSFIDAKFAVQTSLLSKRWKPVWRSLPFLNLSRAYFKDVADFSRFIINLITFRDYGSDIASLNLFFTIGIDNLLTNIVIGYAVSHKVQRLLVHDYKKDSKKIRHSVAFDCLYVTQLILYHDANTKLLSWKLPNLTSLFLHDLSLYSWSCKDPDRGLFSEFVNLKNLALVECCLRSKPMEVIKMCSVSLESLRMKNSSCHFKREDCKFVLSIPNLSFFCYEGYRPLRFAASGFNCIKEVKISLWANWNQMKQEKKEIAALDFVNMLCQFESVKNLRLFIGPLRCLAMVLDLLKRHSYPFTGLKCLKIQKQCTGSNSFSYKNDLDAVYADLMAYFREGSPTAAFSLCHDYEKYFPPEDYVQAEHNEWFERNRKTRISQSVHDTE